METKKFDKEAWLKRCFADPARNLPEYPTLRDLVDLFTAKVSDIEIKFAALQDLVQRRMDEVANIEKWFSDHVRDFEVKAAQAAVNAAEVRADAIQTDEQKQARMDIEAVVQAKFDKEAPELAKAVFNAICKKIQPHALK